LKPVKRAALYVKSRPGIYTLLGSVFFGLTVISAIFWWCGSDAEPTTFLLSMISTVFFALPSVAEFFYPNRKLVRDMMHQEILDFITTTNSAEDWVAFTRKWMSERFLKEDPKLRVRITYDDEGTQCEDFFEPWANQWLHPKATGYWCDIYYDHNLIERLILVAVDQGNCLLPTPEGEARVVNDLDFTCGKLFDVLGNFDDYFRKAKFVRDAKSPNRGQ
jgi:hypothetical protein